jgi:hypothetical protein
MSEDEEGKDEEEEEEELGYNFEALGFPPDWDELRLREYLSNRYHPIIDQDKNNRKYIFLRKDGEWISLGKYSDEKWKVVNKIKEEVDTRPPIEERIKELRKEKLNNFDMAQVLYKEGYPTQQILKAGLPLRKAGRKVSEGDELVEKLASSTKWPGYAEELKELIRKQISLSREFAEACTEAGVQVVFAALKKTNLATDDLRKIFTNKEALTDAVSKAAETALKAIEAYDSDAMRRVEEERDEARAAYAFAVAKLKQLEKALDPALSVEKMIHTYLMSGNVDPNVFSQLMDNWLELRLNIVKMEAIEK